MKKIFLFIAIFIGIKAFAQNPVIVTQPYKFQKYVHVAGSLFSDSTLLNTDSSNRVATTAWMKRNYAAVSEPNSILSGLDMSVVGSTLTVQPGTWQINNTVYSKGTSTNFTLVARDSVLSTYETVYATTSNTIGIAVGTSSVTPVEPSIPANTIRVGAVLITPIGTVVYPPLPSTAYIQANPSALQNVYFNVRKGTLDSLIISTPGGSYQFPAYLPTSGQSLFYGPTGQINWATPNVNGVGYGLLLSSNNAYADTTKLATPWSIRDSLLAHTAVFSPDYFKVSHDSIFWADSIKSSNSIIKSTTISFPALTSISNGPQPGLLIKNNETSDGRAVVQFKSSKNNQWWEVGANIAGQNKSFGIRRMNGVALPNVDYLWYVEPFTDTSVFPHPVRFTNTRAYTPGDSAVYIKNGFLEIGPAGGGGGTNIYNSNGSLTADRTLTGAGHSLDMFFHNGVNGTEQYLDSTTYYLDSYGTSNNSSVNQDTSAIEMLNQKTNQYLFYLGKTENVFGNGIRLSRIVGTNDQGFYLSDGRNEMTFVDYIKHSGPKLDSLSIDQNKFTAWSVVHKKYLDSAIAAAVPATITASGGNTKSGNNIQWGTGTLIGTTVAITVPSTTTFTEKSTSGSASATFQLFNGVLSNTIAVTSHGSAYSQYNISGSDPLAKIGYQNNAATAFKSTSYGVAGTGIQVLENVDSVGYDYSGISSAKQRLRRTAVPSIGTTILLIDSVKSTITASPGGSNTQVQYNNAGSFGGISGATTDGTTLTVTAPVINGISSGTGVSTTNNANTLVLRDGNANAFANNFVSYTTNTASAGGTTVLVPNSTRLQILTGTLAQTYQLPNANASGMIVGSSFEFNNNSTGTLTVTDHGGNVLIALPAGGYARVIETNSSSANGTWDVHTLIPPNSTWGTAGVTVGGTTTLKNTATGTAGTDSLMVKHSGGLVDAISPTYYATSASVPIAANPTASVGLTAVNGSASTFMRSDAAPVLSQSITPIWTGLHTHQFSNLTTSLTDAIFLQNPTAATSGSTKQNSPGIHFGAQLWNSGTTANNWGDFFMLAEANANIASTPNVTLSWYKSLTTTSTPSYTRIMTLDNGGNLITSGSLQTSGSVIASNNVQATNSLTGKNTLLTNSNITAGNSGSVNISNTYNQSGSVSGTDIAVNRVETALGSGVQLFQNFSVNGVSKWTIDHTGLPNSATFTASTPLQADASKNIISSPVGQVALVSGTKAITITGLTTSSKAFVQLVSQGGTSTTTWQFTAVCTSNTLTITAITTAGATNTSDTSTVNYWVVQ